MNIYFIIVHLKIVALNKAVATINSNSESDTLSDTPISQIVTREQNQINFRQY